MLVAHPRLLDPNFRRTILLLSHHSADEGAIGLILNRPLKKTFGEVAAQKISDDFRDVELYYGGPAAADHLTLASLQWVDKSRLDRISEFYGEHRGRLHRTAMAIGSPRILVGYAGWSRGQLEGEIDQKAWLVLPPARELIEMNEPENARC